MNYKKILQVMISFFLFTVITFIFPSSPMAEEKEKIVKHEAGFYYTIKKGDTLWDISEQFFDSPWQWPELWKENKQIPNPHRIYPGERIRLYHRDGIERIIQKPKAIEEEALPAKAIEEEALPAKASVEIKKEAYYYYPSIDNIGFIRKKPVTPSGSIFKVKDDKWLISKGDFVYIKQIDKADPLDLGNRYTAYRTLMPTEDKKLNASVGKQYYLTGIVEITKREPGFAIAKVAQSFRSIHVNDYLIPYSKRSKKITLTESKEGLEGKIIATEEHRSIIGDTTIAFIDKGDKDGVKSGQFYSIYYQETELSDSAAKKEVPFTAVDLGTLIVLHTEKTTSTVLITKSNKSIYPGARIRTPR